MEESGNSSMHSARFLQFSSAVKVAAQVVKENRVTKFDITGSPARRVVPWFL